ncbi:NAD(P)/FAD-dependent oxidoreductase [Helicobacter sp. MIT 14-3879]|uniref:NAD(P)/FAD-dependent oxidoreductase n=1 Tax=Helicobacter sp. MIT 14-3879 TaxID=2040649 RepID=UPI000E1F1345|nr:NAD(P)/FAD-dependent oxidoreductase [Helicobacter sp. MIT 14-3879]RDU60644.1 FAD-dependent oxidoreductase [Helicobacter sp. MIT 14-3879]
MEKYTEIAKKWIASFEVALNNNDIEGILSLFQEECYWRDLISFTWNIKTFEGKGQIKDMLVAQLADTKARNFIIQEVGNENNGIIEVFFFFETLLARGRGILRLKGGLCWTILTTSYELIGFEEKKNKRRVMGAEHGIDKNRLTWLEKKQKEESELGYTKQPYVLIIGGGQGGIALGARLKRLGVPTLICDKQERAGDQWRNRYKSLCLHDPIWYDHLPYLPFPDDWPVFSPKDKIADWLECYVKIMELNYWSNAEVTKANFDEKSKIWEVKVNKDGKEITLKPTQLVFALGMSGVPNVPKLEGAELFKGEQQHSSEHKGPEQYKGKNVIVLGANNSAHDICAALWENDAKVTMIQRSSTHIVRSNSLMEIVLGGLYSEEAVESGITTQKADLIFASIPFKVMPHLHKELFDEIRKRDKEFYDKLEKRGFLLDFGDDDSGLFLKYLRRASGYYIDVGASELIANGDINLERGNIAKIKENSVVLDNGKELPADLIVYATGFSSMNFWVEKIVSKEMADKVGKVWGLGSNTTKDPGPWEGELRNMWKPTQQENLWFHGGNLHQSRHYSLYLSLQLKARYEGLKTQVYGLQEVYHLF